VFFDTAVYAIFLTLIVVAYWQLGWRRQNVLLLAGSYIFYGWWDPRFLGLIALSTIVDFYSARIIARSSNPICEGPSSPMETPQCDPTHLMFAIEMAPIRK